MSPETSRSSSISSFDKMLFPKEPEKLEMLPILSTGQKVGLVAIWIFSGALLTLAILASKGSFHLPSWAVTAAELVTGIQGSCLLLFTLTLLPWAYKERKLRLEAASRQKFMGSSNHKQPVQSPKLDGKRKIDEAELVEMEDLIDKGVKVNDFYFDLENSQTEDAESKELSATQFGLFPIPNIGFYQNGKDSFDPLCHYMAAKLPFQQLLQFPESIQAAVADSENVECFFAVFKKPDNASDYVNLSLHGMVLPDYQPNGDKPNGEKISCTLSMEPIDGINTQKHQENQQAIPINDQSREFNHILHPQASMEKGKRQLSTCVSFSKENDPRIYLEPGKQISSCYISGVYENKAVVLHALFINDEGGQDDAKILKDATQKENLKDFLSAIKDNGSDENESFQAIEKTFQTPIIEKTFQTPIIEEEAQRVLDFTDEV